ncbi:MAG: O-antigen ligase family protein [Bacteroidales bacterium]|nr:O-antigen ligase family protein [Bacteroidales bacterium]
MITEKQILRYWYIFSLCVIIVSLPFSKIGLSIGQFLMAAGWIVDRFETKRWREKHLKYSGFCKLTGGAYTALVLLFKGIWKGILQFFRHKPALIFSSIFLIHLAGLLITTDFDYALKDLRTKIPLFLLPLFLSTSGGFNRRDFHRIMMLFIAAILVRTLYNTGLIQTHHFIDIRDISRNVSHIILGLLISLSIFSLGYFSLQKHLFPGWLRTLFIIVLIWFLSYLIISQSFTGLAITLLILMILVPVMIFKTRNRWLKTGILISFLVVLCSLGLYFSNLVKEYYIIHPVDYSKLEPYSSRGNKYIHNINSLQTENGNYLWIYIQWDELRMEWNKRSNIPFDSLDKKKQPVAYTLVRFLTSKGWRKDADAVSKLSPLEIDAIEKGVTNEVFLKEFSIRGRVYEILWGYDNYVKTGNPTGSSLMQRLEFWKASLGIIKEHWLTGVGTGDMNIAFQQQYEKIQTKLAPDQRWRSHNQFLSIFIGFGIFGFLWFLFAFIYPILSLHWQDDFFVVVFMMIALFSMITEDTIESQTGVTFFAFFYSFFLFSRNKKESI